MRPAIGLEIHVQLNTQTKLFCSCSSRAFGAAPNSNICPVCIGDPGVLPVLNREAVSRVTQMGLAMKGTIAENSFFARKNYFYPDLPKNYQISQYEEPIVKGGVFEFFSGGELKKISIHRIHLEEDAGKLLHAVGSRELDYSLVDFNRAGIPLAETVTEPDFENASQASDFLAALRATLRALGSSNCDMEKGEMRFDVNISISADQNKLGTKVEIKNLNSFKAVRDALDFEISRQREVLKRGGRIIAETMLWNVKNNETQPLRSKEEASDYRYFKEPDLTPIFIDSSWRASLEANFEELPMSRIMRCREIFGLDLDYAQTLVFHEDPSVYRLFKETLELIERGQTPFSPGKKVSVPGGSSMEGGKFTQAARTAANWILNDLLGQLKTRGLTVEKSGMTAPRMAEFLSIVEKGNLTSRVGKDLLAKLLNDPAQDAQKALKEGGWDLAPPAEENILLFVREAIAENPRAASEFQSGKDKALQALVGSVMKKSRGQAHPQKLQELLKKELTKK